MCGPTITSAQTLLLGDYHVFQVALRRIASLAQYTDRVEASGDVCTKWARNPHAVVMRTGYPEDQFVVGTSVSPMGHIQADSDSIVLGMRKRWWMMILVINSMPKQRSGISPLDLQFITPL